MLDGPVVAGIVFAGGAAVVGGYFYLDHLRHSRGQARTPRGTERIPLFGVEMPHEGNGDGTKAPTRMPRPDLAPRRPAAGEFAPPASGGRMGSPAAESPAVGVAGPGAGDASQANGGNGSSNAGPYAPPPFDQAQYGTAQYSQAPEWANRGMTRQAPAAFPAPRYADGQTLRFALPDEGTLQFLPGRLQVVAGPESGREIRFVRSPNTGSTDVTFGRSEGPPHRHVQLLVPTVSRRHALMSLIDEHWSLQNLSATNPVTHNGRRLAPDEVVPLLVDGDRIEMGEIVFVFHSR